MISVLTPAQLRAAYAREWQELCEASAVGLTQSAAAARRPVPDTIVCDDPVPPCYVLPTWAKRGYVGE